MTVSTSASPESSSSLRRDHQILDADEAEGERSRVEDDDFVIDGATLGASVGDGVSKGGD